MHAVTLEKPKTNLYFVEGRRRTLSCATALLILLTLQALGSSRVKSAAFDEPYHLGAGYTYLRTGDMRLSSDHPPLIDAWLADPLLLLDPQLPLESAAWQRAEYGSFGDVFLWQANPDLALRMIQLGRLSNVALAVLLGVVLLVWTSELAGRTAGLLALGLYTLDPNIVANARLATNDLGVAAMLFAATWAWWKWLECPSIPRLLLAGLLAGAACASKYSGLVIGPIALILALTHNPPAPRPSRAWRGRVAGLVGLGAICLLTIWAAYGFSFGDGLPAPSFWQGIRFQSQRIVHGQPVYALGKTWPNGVWFYYPLALLLKTPLPTLLLFGAGLALAARRRAWRPVWPALLGLLVFGAVTLTSSLQLGHRYLLPLLPFMFGVAGYAATALPRPSRQWRSLAPLASVGLLLLWLTLEAARIYPHHLSFFNQLAGGPEGADHYLVDANLDWGQDLPVLKDLMDEHQIPFVHLGYFGSSVPNLYQIRYWPAPGFLRFVGDPESMAFNPYTPEPGWYAVSRTSLRQGLVLTHPDLYAFFRSHTPQARAGYSIDLYRVDYPADVPVVRAVVWGARLADVPAGQLGWQEGQRLIAKWLTGEQAFVFAMNGPARYLTSAPLSFAPDLRQAVLSQAQTDPAGALEFDARPIVRPLLQRWTDESAFWTPEGQPLTPNEPVEFDGRLQLLGYRLEPASPQREVPLTLAWAVTGALQPPIATFVHLLDPDGSARAQYDGWAAAVQGLEVGDVIVHHVRIPVPPEAPAGTYRLQVGVYTPGTMQRWPVQTSDGMVLDRVWLPEVEIP